MAVALCAAVVLATSCTASRLSPDDAVRVSGRLLDEAGRPRAGARVALVKEVDLGEALLGVTLAVGTLGLVCLADPPPAICAKAKRATTGADGRFAIDLRGRDTQGLVGTASRFVLSTSAPPGPGEAAGPLVAARFTIQTTARELPDLRLWHPRLAVAPGRAEWAPLDPGYGPLDGYTVTYAGEPSRPAVVWSVGGPSPATFDPRSLEDAKGTVAVAADVTQQAAGGRVQVTARSASVPFAGTAGPPPSRGLPCTASGASDTASGASGTAATPVAPCTVTDGDFANMLAGPPPGATEVRTAVAVDLGRSRAVSLVVVRGCPGTCVVETSADGRAWAAAGPGTGDRFAVAPRAGTTARWVRARSSTGLDVSRLAEISVW